jgi:hypothetical protein
MERGSIIHQASGPEHGTSLVMARSDENIPRDRVYVDPQTGQVYDGRRGQKLADVPDGAVELPVTTWYR